jgi:predicted phosphoadenosine phosphosulfate sulfurtransferase
MSNGRWQIDEQLKQLGTGKNATQRVLAYEKLWRNRCYTDDIPDEVPDLLSKTGRAPSWKKIAICLLNDDMKLRGLGYTEASYDPKVIKSIEAESKPKERDLFNWNNNP